MSQNPAELYKNTPNPFSSIKVRNPFEMHPDYSEIYHDQFAILKAILYEIKGASNNQSQGVIILGKPGSGKTHLVMRLAQEVLKTNRLFFIPHPNDERAVNYHTYAQILKSFSEIVKPTNLTQLEQFFAKSFVNILSQTEWATTVTGCQIIEQLKNDNLSLYERVGQPGSNRYRNNWDRIQRHILNWWQENYGLSTYYSSRILIGIIRFCRYTDPDLKAIIRHWLAGNGDTDSEELKSVRLDPWPDDFNREEFALEAIQTLGKLSLLDEPLILIFDQLESLFQKRHRFTLESFGATVKEILTHVPNSLVILNLFPESWQRFQEVFDGSVVDLVSQSVVTLNRPSKFQLFQLLQTLCQSKIEADSSSPKVDIEHLFTKEELVEIVSQPSIRSVINRASDYFRYKAQGFAPPSLDVIKPKANSDQEAVIMAFQELKKAIEELKQELQARDGKKTVGAIMPSEKDEKLGAYWENLWEILCDHYETNSIIYDENDVGKVKAIVSAFSTQYDLSIDQLSCGLVIPANLRIATKTKTHVIAFLHRSGNSFTYRIRNFNNDFVQTHPNTRFRLMRDQQDDAINPNTQGWDEIQKLREEPNGEYVIMDKQDRVRFECLYQLIIDFENQELEFDVKLADIVNWIARKQSDYWLIQCLTQ